MYRHTCWQKLPKGQIIHLHLLKRFCQTAYISRGWSFNRGFPTNHLHSCMRVPFTNKSMVSFQMLVNEPQSLSHTQSIADIFLIMSCGITLSTWELIWKPRLKAYNSGYCSSSAERVVYCRNSADTSLMRVHTKVLALLSMQGCRDYTKEWRNMVHLWQYSDNAGAG